MIGVGHMHIAGDISKSTTTDSDSSCVKMKRHGYQLEELDA
jgi:hypothetical protein